MSARLPDIGMAIRIRAAVAADRGALAVMLAAMDRYGLYQRHFSHSEVANLALLKRLDSIDGMRQVVVVAETTAGELIAHGEFVADAEDVNGSNGAEFAVMVLPSWRGMGIAGSMLKELMARAKATGQVELRGMIQAGNTAMLRLAQGLGFTRKTSDDPAVVLVSRELSASATWPQPPTSC